jgi:cell division protein FtsI/penicillin-binding protein 2
MLVVLLPTWGQQPAPDLYAQATRAMLDRRFPARQVEYVLLDARTRKTIARRWEHAEAGIPVGSLLKPFVALAYGRLMGSEERFPAVYCRGKIDGCWRPGGHGQVTLERALAESCNTYFLALARKLAAHDESLKTVSAEYGLPQPPERVTAMMLIGVTPEWRIAPAALARAYAKLAETDDRTAERLLAGMRAAALPGGTAARLGPHAGGVLAKTGTAPCVANADGPRCVANGDGLVVAMAPADRPRWVLLVRQRGTTGAHTAEIAGKMLASLEGADAQRP